MRRQREWGVVALLIGVLWLSGCGIKSEAEKARTKVTINGSITVPEIKAQGMLPMITVPHDPTVLEKMAASGTCLVNGKEVPFFIATPTRTFTIGDIEAAGAYDVWLAVGKFSLRGTFPHTGITMVKNLDLNSTAEAHLMEKYAFTMNQLLSLKLREAVVDELAQSLLSALQNSALQAPAVSAFLTAELSRITGEVPLASAVVNLPSNIDVTGNWQAAGVVYYTLNSAGERSFQVKADALLQLQQVGSNVSGKLTLQVRSSNMLATRRGGGYTPASEIRSIEGTVNGSVLQFGRLSTAGGRSNLFDERWSFTATNATLSGKVANLNTTSFIGLDSDAGAFTFTRR